MIEAPTQPHPPSMPAQADGGRHRVVFGPDSLVPISTFIALVGAMVAGTVFIVRLDERQARLDDSLDRLERSQGQLRSEIQELRREVTVDDDGYVTKEGFDNYMKLLRACNSDLVLPESLPWYYPR